MSTKYIVTRDGKEVSDALDTENDAWVYIQKHQAMSVDWAMKYEGWAIKSVQRED